LVLFGSQLGHPSYGDRVYGLQSPYHMTAAVVEVYGRLVGAAKAGPVAEGQSLSESEDVLAVVEEVRGLVRDRCRGAPGNQDQVPFLLPVGKGGWAGIASPGPLSPPVQSVVEAAGSLARAGAAGATALAVDVSTWSAKDVRLWAVLVVGLPERCAKELAAKVCGADLLGCDEEWLVDKGMSDDVCARVCEAAAEARWSVTTKVSGCDVVLLLVAVPFARFDGCDCVCVCVCLGSACGVGREWM
jgi:hypothetical protein